jgi:hypothetical protein
MNRDPENREKVGTEKTTKSKKVYRKPSFQHERVFETMALACGKINPISLQCSTNRKNS